MVDTHPGLTFLLEAPEFHSRYVNTVSICFDITGYSIIQLLPLSELPLSEGDMTICSPEACDIARGRSPRAILLVEGEQVIMSPSLKGNNDCFIIPNPFLN